jgi:hypothetical protein
MSEPKEIKIKTFSLRLEMWICDKLISVAGERSLNEFIKEILITHLEEPQKNQARTINEPQTELLKEIELKNEIIRSKDQTIKVLENQNGFLIIEFQKMSALNERILTPSQEEQQEKRKAHFWEFWKT